MGLARGTKTRLMAGFLVLLLSGCASVPPFRPDPGLPRQTELEHTPFFPQEAHQCGPSALATLLNYRGVRVTPQELQPQVFLPERQGSLQIELAATARRYGLLAYPLAPTLDALLREVAAGNPVLVLQNLAFDWIPRWHYAVVIGYDLQQREILLRSGRERRWRSGLKSFARTWQRAGNWGLVILSPDSVPETAELMPYLRSALELEQSGEQKAALAAYRSASRHWPDDARAWLALGNLSHAMKMSRESIIALQTASRLDPENPIIWNNLAYSFLQGSCPMRAVEAIGKALTLAPGDSNLQQSHQEINELAGRLDRSDCKLTK